MTRTTRADLLALTRLVENESRIAGILPEFADLALILSRPPAPYRLRIARGGPLMPFEPADGNGGDIGRTAREAEHALRIMWYTLQAANRVHR